jgi:hypothetical protein
LPSGDLVRTEHDAEDPFEFDVVLGQETGDQAGLCQGCTGYVGRETRKRIEIEGERKREEEEEEKD